MEGSALTTQVHLPKTGANEISGTVRRWEKQAGSRVARGDVLGEIETSKAIVEIEAEADGWFYPLTSAGESAAVGAVIAVIADRADVNPELLRSLVAPVEQEGESASDGPDDATVWTKKAELLADRHNVDRGAIERFARVSRITEEHVRAFLEMSESPDLPTGQSSVPGRGVERVLVIGSVLGGGAAIVVDSLLRSSAQLPVGIVDRDSSTHGRSVLGIRVLGSSDPQEVLALYRSQAFDAAVLAFNRNVEARAEAFEELRALGVPFTNVIDPTANVRSAVSIGVGNVILGSSYIGPEADIGDNNFLSSNTCIEHHCKLGSHNAFGPAVALSGRVTVGDRVRFGTQIAIEPGIHIGSDSIVASSCVITADVPERSLLRAKVTLTVSRRPDVVASYVL